MPLASIDPQEKLVLRAKQVFIYQDMWMRLPLAANKHNRRTEKAFRPLILTYNQSLSRGSSHPVLVLNAGPERWSCSQERRNVPSEFSLRFPKPAGRYPLPEAIIISCQIEKSSLSHDKNVFLKICVLVSRPCRLSKSLGICWC